MRRVTVRVSEPGDWLFQAEHVDGRVLFAVEVTESDVTPAAHVPAPPSPGDPPAKPEEHPYHLGDFGMMLGAPDESWDEQLYNLADLVEMALPHKGDVRVVEIGAGSGETTVAYARDRSKLSLWLIAPFAHLASADIDEAHARRALEHNRRYIPAFQVLDDDAINVARNLSKQDLSLVIISPQYTAAACAVVAGEWRKHLRPDGQMIIRSPIGSPPDLGMNIDQAGEWLLYSPAKVEGA